MVLLIILGVEIKIKREACMSWGSKKHKVLLQPNIFMKNVGSPHRTPCLVTLSSHWDQKHSLWLMSPWPTSFYCLPCCLFKYILSIINTFAPHLLMLLNFTHAGKCPCYVVSNVGSTNTSFYWPSLSGELVVNVGVCIISTFSLFSTFSSNSQAKWCSGTIPFSASIMILL